MTQALTSTVPAAKSKLVERLAARPALADVKVRRQFEGLSQRTTTIPSAIWLGAVTNQLEIPTMRGGPRRSREESYTLAVHFLASKAGAGTSVVGSSTAAAVESHVLDMLAELDDELATNISLGLSDSGFLTAKLAGWEMGEVTEEDRGWTARLDAVVACRARLA